MTIDAGGCTECGKMRLPGETFLCEHGVAVGPTMTIQIETEVRMA